jgi:septal ring factor EnvC (AmiA/AmiB activator)
MRGISKAMMWLLLGLLTGAFLLGPVGCTKYAKEEDLQALDQQKQAALSAEQELQQKVQERQELENQLQQKQDELTELQGERDAVAAKVQQQ